jgi:hypothetical protein
VSQCYCARAPCLSLCHPRDIISVLDIVVNYNTTLTLDQDGGQLHALAALARYAWAMTLAGRWCVKHVSRSR